MADPKYNAPAGAPPNYPQQPQQAYGQQQHYDAGPMPQSWQIPQGMNANQWQQQPNWGPQGQQGYYGPPGMQYGQPGMPPQGYIVDERRGPGAGEGCCAAFLGALACCCCLELLF